MNVEKIFGTRVFDDSAMKKRLPQKVYQSLLRTRRLGQPLDPQIADVVACAMKEWALEQGATHYSHWFQPMNNFTAGKHDAFLTTNGGQGGDCDGVFQQGADSGRGGFLLLPLRRLAGNL